MTTFCLHSWRSFWLQHTNKILLICQPDSSWERHQYSACKLWRLNWLWSLGNTESTWQCRQEWCQRLQVAYSKSHLRAPGRHWFKWHYSLWRFSWWLFDCPLGRWAWNCLTNLLSYHSQWSHAANHSFLNEYSWLALCMFFYRKKRASDAC